MTTFTEYKIEILSPKSKKVEGKPSGLPSYNGEIVRYISAKGCDGSIREIVAKFTAPEAAIDFGKRHSIEVHHIFPMRAKWESKP